MSLPRLFLCLLVWMLALAPHKALALNPEYTIFQYNTRSWGRTNGLPSNAVNSIVQTQDGHVWLGTSKGLVDFDGIEFHVIGLPGQDEARPLHIATMQRRSAGGLWVGIERGGFGYFEQGRYTPVQRQGFGADFPTTRVIHESRDSSLFVSFVGAAGRQLPSGMIDRFAPETDVMCLHEDSCGRVWLGTATRGLQYWENGRVKTVTGAAEALWRGYVISSVQVDHEGLIWVGASNGLHCLNPDFSPRPSTGIGSQPKVMLQDSHGVLWIGTLSAGLLRYKDGVFSSLRHRDGLASDRILSLAESSDGSLWVGTEEGLSQLTDVKFPILSASEGLAADSCLTVITAADGSLWAGTSNGLTHIQDGKCTSFGIDKANGFKSEWIRRILQTRNGDLYLLSGQREISLFRDGNIIRSWPTDIWARLLVEDAEGLIVAVGPTLMRLGVAGLTPFLLADGTTLDLGWINEMIVSRDGSLWLAAKAGVVQVKNGKAVNWALAQKWTDTAFFYLLEDSLGGVWAARNTGLVRFKNGQVGPVTREQGLYENLIYAIVQDQLGNFWLDSPAGIFRASLTDLNAVVEGRIPRVNCMVYDGQHVVKTSDKSVREYSGACSKDGRIWFPCSKGLIRIDPSFVPVNNKPPPVYLQRVLVDGLEYPVGHSPSLEPGSGNLEFDYAALDFQAPERVRYRYCLEGYQREWVEAGARRSAFFTNLNPGQYRFRVQACNADGVWNTEGVSFSLTLPRRFYETWWFRASVVVLLLGLIGLAAWTRERRKRREYAEIHHREELQRQMIESSPVAMAMLENRHRVLYSNATFTRIFGYTLAEIPDIEILWRLVCPDQKAREELQREAKHRSEAAAPQGRATEPIETLVLCKDGTQRTIAFTTSEVGERTLIVFSDLTDRKRAEDERRKLEEQLRQGQKMEAIGQLSGGVAHDFNNLLTVILGNVSLIETLESIPETLQESLNEIKGAAQRAANLTRQLLAFSRKQPMRPVRLDLNQVVSEMTRMLRRILGEDIQMELQLAAGPVFVRGDSGMIEQVLLNLSVNARDAMPTGGRLVLGTSQAVFVPGQASPKGQARSGSFVCISVADTGCGIPPELLPRIFEPFFTTKDVGRGTGLGLATVYGIVQQHDGWIDVTSVPGQGTVFRIYLPTSIADAQPSETPTALHAGAVVSGQLILLVEDDAGVRTLARKTLLASGHRVMDAASGPLALEIWAAHKDEIGILFTDVVMPGGMNGLELARVLLAERPSLRVVYSSGYSEEVAGGRFTGREGVDFLPKPYAPVDLLKIIHRTAKG